MNTAANCAVSLALLDTGADDGLGVCVRPSVEVWSDAVEFASDDGAPELDKRYVIKASRSLAERCEVLPCP